MDSTLILASASPRRQTLLAQLGVHFSVFAPQVPEVRAAGEHPKAYVLRLAMAKAQAILQNHPTAWVLGADTTVECEGRVFEKPQSAAEGQAMLAALSGRSHQVHTAIAVCHAQGTQTNVVTTQVDFRPLAPHEPALYWATGEPCDKAGGYAIQGLGAVFIRGIRGSYSNVVGLPLAETAELLQATGFPLWNSAP